MRHSLVLLTVFFGLCLSLSAQDLTQSVQGVVREEATGRPIEGARVVLKDTVAVERAFTDADGVFKMENIKVGRYLLDVTAPGYEAYLQPDLLVVAGKQSILEVQLIQSGGSLDSIVISTDRTRQLAGLSTRIFTVDETRRFAASYFDPARLVNSYPGVAGVNDQANHLSIRGNSPNAMSWRLEGVDIVNPNHLTNAGTFSDRPSLNGGGVNIISTQMMTTSSFKNGAFDPTYGNVLSGVMDMRLRRGNPSKDEYIFQFGLTGLDLAAEGPIGSNGRDAFVGNFRYSTVGLLTSMGVDFGDEKINFWDASFNASFVGLKSGTFTVFGMYGQSKNLFEGTHVDSLREFEKDASDIEYKGRMGAIGLTHNILVGKRLLFKTVIATSYTDQNRNEDFIVDSLARERIAEDQLGETRISMTTSATYQLSPGSSLQVGGFATFFWYKLNNRYREPGAPGDLNLLANADGTTSLFQPYIRWRGFITDKLSLDLGAHAMYLTLNGDFSIEPRASFRYQIDHKQSITLGYGLHSRMQPFNMYFTPTDTTDGDITYINKELGFTRAHHAVLSYAYRFSESFSVKVEPYYQYLFNVPIVNRPNSSFSALNLFEGVITDTLENAGTGQNYGVELSVEKTLARNFYFLVSGAYYQSTYVGGDTVVRNTRYNGNYLASATAGYEWDLSKKKEPRPGEEETEKQKKKREKKEAKEKRRTAKGKAAPKPRQSTLGVDMRFVYQGGYRTTPIDTLASEIAETTIYKESEAWSQQLPDFMRLDLRLSWTRQKPNYTRTLALDIQNALNQQNIAWQYYDRQKKQVVSKYQLGIIPLLTYRIEF